MTTSIIDTTLHTSSFPSTYTGPGTLIGNPVPAGGVVESVAGYFTSNGNVVQINVGFRPIAINIINTTDGITWGWQYGMPAANSVKTTLGGSLASVQDTGTAISVANGPAGGNGSSTVTLSATLTGTAKNICYLIEG
jgi:hypothetical protein